MKKVRLFVLGLMLLPLSLWAQIDLITFSSQGGLYESSFDLSIGCSSNNHIRYTINGSTPTAQSTLYVSPLHLDETLYSPSQIHTIINCIPSVYYAVEDVKKAIVIRAAAFDANDSCVSPVVTNTYCIKELGCDLHGLPVVSIVTDSLNLFDYDTGIFVPGVNYNPIDSFVTGNYTMRGREWERPINMEFYEPDGQGINQQCGLRIHGGASRWFQQKGMRVYAREEYGKKNFTHRFFETMPIVKFKHLSLHPFRCSNWLQTGGQEYLAQRVAANMDIDCLAVRETVVFINGEYWGIYTLEESPDERYLESHYDADLDEVNMLKYWGVPQYGDPDEWREIYIWMHTADLTQPEDSIYAYTHIDVSSFIDYILLETFSANLDWPQNNVLLWQLTTGQPFRFIFYDGDGCFTWPDYDAMYSAMHAGGNSVILNAFMENTSFREAFYSRYLQLKGTHLSYESMKQMLDHYGQTVEGEIESQVERFFFPNSKEQWLEDMEKADQFLQTRFAYYETEWDWIGLDEHPLSTNTLACYPNPAESSFVVSLNCISGGETDIEVFDVTGRKVSSRSVVLNEGENRFVMEAGLPSGLYLVRAGSQSQRIVIK